MGTTGASRIGPVSWLAAAALLAGCPRIEVGGIPAVESATPSIRVGLLLSQRSIVVGGGSALLVSGEDGAGLTELPAGSTGEVLAERGLVAALIGGIQTPAARTLVLRPTDSAGSVRVAGREYRGEVLLAATPDGVRAVNLLSIEEYVAGVINAEMGRRPLGDSAAVLAQAVISRTVAMRALGRYRIRGYDVMGTIADQAYGGIGSETPMAWDAVRATRGEVLTHQGAVIEAFFHSTCGGKTEAVDEVFSGPPQPYLRSISDRDPSGQAYCALSPRFRWREEWTGDALARTLNDNARLAGIDGELALRASDLQISQRSFSGRATELVVVAGSRAQPIRGQQTIRQVLRGADGGWLRSSQFTLLVSKSGGRVVKIAAEGGGAGHGVGMCQWGAVGRARSGFSYRDILSAYFPETEIQRLY